ncbi:hypothetical protein K469DRAFT_607684, partial [Zopfia rhizophila CBS 207.26]
NIEQFKPDIDMAQLLPLFQDTISVARLLGFRFIWRDALCLIHNDAGNSHNELMDMGMIHKNRKLNIAATGSNNQQGGLLHAHDTRLTTRYP